MAEHPQQVAGARLAVPDLFSAQAYEQVLILTYNADLEFYERVLRRHFGSYRNQIVLADGQHLARSIEAQYAAGTLRHLNRTWLAGPIRSAHSAHAKAVLLAGPDRGLLLVGSGNMSLHGYVGAGEVFTPYRWTPDEPGDLAAFTLIRSLTDGLARRGHLDATTRERLDVFWRAYDWWHRPPTAEGPLRHNLDVPIGRQLLEYVAGDPVEQLTLAAPFHDPDCRALERLIRELRPQSVRVLVQPSACSVDPERLTSVLQECNGEVWTIGAAGESDPYLHAKVIVVTTRDREICVTGSANCSLVALWLDHPSANVELATIVDGPVGAFAYLFDEEVVTLDGPIDATELDVGIHEDDGANGAPPLAITDVVWRSPLLTGNVVGTIDVDLVTVEIDGQPASIEAALDPAGDSLRIRVTDAAHAELIDRVAVVRIVHDGDLLAIVVPYQAERLAEQDRRRSDPDRLRRAARLDIDDPDLERALAALEEVLVGERAIRWTRDSDRTAGEQTSGDLDIAWEDIDWEAVRSHPTYAAYGGLRGFGVAGSDLAAYLDGLSNAVRELADPDAGPETGRPTEGADDDLADGDFDAATGVDGAEVDDPIDEDEPEPANERRRQTVAARNLRLIRGFVRRNLRLLEQPAFRAGAGPGITIPNLMILNWVCWWVATGDPDRPGELLDERLRIWAVLWGESPSSPGHLADLSDDDQELVLDRFDDQRLEAVLLASIQDVWSHIPSEDDPRYTRLCMVLRSAVTHPCWQITASHVGVACRLANDRPVTEHPTDPLALAGLLWSTACEAVGDADAKAVIAAAVGVRPRSVRFTDQSIVVDGGNRTTVVRQAEVLVGPLELDEVVAAFAAWEGVEERPHYRLCWEGGVAMFSADARTGWVHDAVDESTVDLPEVQRADPPWRRELDRLYDSVERDVDAGAA